MSPPLSLAPLGAAPATAVETLLDAAFGRDRRLRTAYRLRERAEPVASLSRSAWAGPRLVGVLQCWPVVLAAADRRVPLVLVGPVAVVPDGQAGGVGTAMMRHMLTAADAGIDPAGDVLVMVGDPVYYGRFGFSSGLTGGWWLPGPWEPHRLLARRRGTRALPVAAALAPPGADPCPAPPPA